MVQGNQNWMRAREALLESDLLPGDLERIYPICTPGGSDTARFDEVLELLHLGGRSLPPRRPHDNPGGLGEPRDDV
jgi:glutamate synthase (NADPH/NADH) large chain